MQKVFLYLIQIIFGNQFRNLKFIKINKQRYPKKE